ncbi:MAG: dicarboxylate/amino acid:cation symporter [Gammaproteobacteria bacterium]|jgi:Na+/H+-dicarboxylate symporter|nr:dicarboxylate/amino acid:cation symporter [Gammaproteobacteria bacterium]
MEIKIIYWAVLAVTFVGIYLLGSRTDLKLWVRVMTALLIGAIIGFIFGDLTQSSKWIGDLFVRFIRMLIVPLIFTSLVAGVVSMGDPKRLGSIGIKTIVLYLMTTFFAIIIGLTLGTIFNPGAGIDLSGVIPFETASSSMSVSDRLFGIVPTNPISSLANGEVLPIIFFSILLGVGIILGGEKTKSLGNVFSSAAEAVLKIAHLVMQLAPYGVLSLIAWVSGTMGIAALQNLFVLTVILYAGCLIHMIFVYGGLIRVVAGLPLGNFFKGIIDAQAVAYSTSSSSATLPVTLQCVQKNLGVKKTVASSVLPLGATINMDGTALYLGIVALFSAQIFGVQLSFADYFLIAMTATLTSIGTAGIPSASLFLLATVLSVIGITDAQTALIVGFVLPFDRILDMARTVVNITGDATVSVLVAKSEGELDETEFRDTSGDF